MLLNIPEVLRACRANILVQVVPFIFLWSFMAKLNPTGDKLSIDMWRAKAVVVLDMT